jgi:hypothetical protein
MIQVPYVVHPLRTAVTLALGGVPQVLMGRLADYQLRGTRLFNFHVESLEDIVAIECRRELSVIL